jgi:hypothetical protein
MGTLERLSMYFAVSFDEIRKYESYHQFLGDLNRVPENLREGEIGSPPLSAHLRQPTSISLIWLVSHDRFGRLA